MLTYTLNLKRIIETGNVKIDREIINSPSKKIKKNQSISIIVKEKIAEKLVPSEINLNICFEDIKRDFKILNCPCINKSYHTSCINRWLKEKKECPFCKKKFEKKKKKKTTYYDQNNRLRRLVHRAIIYDMVHPIYI